VVTGYSITNSLPAYRIMLPRADPH